MSEIWAVLQHSEAQLDEQSGELLAEMLEVAQRQPAQPDVCAILLTSPDTPAPDLTSLKSQGIARCYVLAHPALGHYSTEAYVSALAWFIRQRSPLLVTCSATANGRDCMARLAARLRLPYAQGCLNIDIQDDALVTLRTMYDGRAYVQSSTALQGRTALATFIPGVRGNPVTHKNMAIRGSDGEITMVTPTINDSIERERIKLIAVQAPSPEDVELEAAERIVAGGRGMGREGFAQVASFARLLGAAVGATRVATDRGWVEHARQIGATGRTVHPRLYIACGISGAAQHTSGMREAQTVIAINPDRTAPIFALADLGLLGDANQILPLAADLMGHN
ncbi:MAG TPA: electron transfer flavoprotein subunit alpha/FixB family protein [Ktedonobacteraceae bacterium]